MQRIVALIDCDCFFVSCERVRDPKLQGKPVCVMTGGGDKGIIVSRSKEAKALGMKSARFTSDEDMSERKIIKEQFSMGNLQALVAIKCLDEGVNIPAIRTAFILASTTNPKEYIQRRGRVLRLSKGKEYANIYDFITLPRPIDTAHYLTDDQAKMELSLIKSEIKRAEEFARISMNKMDAMKLIDSIKEAYSIDKYLLLDEEVL